MKQISSREFNQNASGAKKAAESGPVYITDRGQPAHVLLTYADYERLVGGERIVDALGKPAGVEDAHFELPVRREEAKPATFS